LSKQKNFRANSSDDFGYFIASRALLAHILFHFHFAVSFVGARQIALHLSGILKAGYLFIDIHFELAHS